MNTCRAHGILLSSLVVVIAGLAPAPTVAATGQPATYTLTVVALGNGRTSPAAGTYTYSAGAEVLVTALPALGDAFAAWSGDASGTSKQIVMVMDANRKVTATFASGKSPVSMLPNPPGVGVPRPRGAPGNLTVLDWAGFKGAVSYTFDDSLDSQIQHYATLMAPGVPMTFYINPTTATIYTDAERTAAFRQWFADGNELGNHTYNHCGIYADGTFEPDSCLWTPDLNPPALDTWQAEIADTTAWIQNTLGQYDVWSMAAPYGDDDWSTFAQAAGLLVHRGLWEGMLSPYDLSDQYSLPGFLAAGTPWGGLDDKQASFEQVIDDARQSGSWSLLVFHQVGPLSDNTGCCEVPVGNITGSMSHLKALRDVWGDTVSTIAAYWLAQDLLANAPPHTRGNTTTWTWSLPANFPRHRYLRVKVAGGTLKQQGRVLVWDEHGYYEVSLEAGSLTLTP